jgi:hypothetical protein
VHVSDSVRARPGVLTVDRERLPAQPGLSCHGIAMRGDRLKAAARRLHVRETAERTADSARLLLDSLSDPVYQPVAELGRRYVSADRAAGTHSRWSAMRPVIDEVSPASAADIGCNAGWFTLEVGRLGIPTIGVESHPPYYRAALAAVHRSSLHNVGILALELGPATMGLLPNVDCMTFLSVWHHIVRDEGLNGASEFLRSLWSHTGKLMFFETGESKEFENTGFGLPDMVPDARQWLTDYLTRTCESAAVTHLGVHPSGPGSPSTRSLFAVRRAETP